MFSVQWGVGARGEGEEVKSLYSWLVHLILLTHSAGQSVPRGDLVDTGCRPSYNNKRMPLRREWTKGSNQRHLPKHIYKSRGAARCMEINMELPNVLQLAFTIYGWHQTSRALVSHVIFMGFLLFTKCGLSLCCDKYVNTGFLHPPFASVTSLDFVSLIFLSLCLQFSWKWWGPQERKTI